jgi:hypothetical protein
MLDTDPSAFWIASSPLDGCTQPVWTAKPLPNMSNIGAAPERAVNPPQGP